MGTFILQPNERMLPSLPIGRINRLEILVNALLLNVGITPKTPIEIPNGTIVTYTFSTTFKVIVVDQSRVLTENNGYTLDGTGLIATLDVAPVSSIFAL